jgi:hypothetical protein
MVNMHKRMVVEENQKLRFRIGGLTRSYEMNHHGYMMNITWCYGNTMVVAILEFSKKTSKWKFWHRRQLWLDCEQQSEIANLRLLWGKSNHDLNTTIAEHFLSFVTDIYTLSCDQQFRSYELWTLTRLLKFCSIQNGVSWEILTFDPNSNAISGNHQVPTL